MFSNDFTYSADDKGFDVVVVLDHGDYTYSAGCAATGPSYSSGGEPAEPAEVEISSGMLELDFCAGSFKRLFDLHINATDKVFDALCEKHAEELEEQLLEYASDYAEESAAEASVSKYKARTILDY